MNDLMNRRRALMAEKPRGGKSDMHGWTDGVAYTDLEFVENEYVKLDGQFDPYNGWSRTGFIPCDGASEIVIPPSHYTGSNRYNAFYNSSKSFVKSFTTQYSKSTTVPVPANASFFVLSSLSTALSQCCDDGIVPHK